MGLAHCTTPTVLATGSTASLPAIFANLSDSRLLAQLWQYRANGRPGWPLRPMWRAYVAAFVLNLGSVNDVIRLLGRDRQFRRLCGFGNTLPHRTTFNRFVGRLAKHPELVEQAFASVTEKLREMLPGLGGEVAIDSTTVRTHANPNRRRKADPAASWTAKNSAKSMSGKEWHYGYKLHMVADANYGVPLGVKVTTASRNDSPELPCLMDKGRALFGWFSPRAAMADRGYDAMSNYERLHGHGTAPIILQRKHMPEEYAGLYTLMGTPTCIGKLPMEYVRTDPEKGHLYRCRGCPLRDSTAGMQPHCNDEHWQDPLENLRLFGAIRRESDEWRALYAKRQAIERTFKSLKQSRRLERHYVRGLDRIRLHCLMAVLTYQATVMVSLKVGAENRMRWMVAKVA